MDLEWDENKNKSNNEKHGLDFSNSEAVLNDPDKTTIEIENSKESTGEYRFMTIGKLYNVLHTAIWTARTKFIRIISLRRSNKKEIKLYNKKTNR